MNFDFSSPWADAAASIRQLMLDREAKRRQVMLDQIALDREARLKEHDAADLANTRENTASVIAQREAAIADRKRAAAEKERTDFAATHLPEDVVSGTAPVVTANPDLFDKQMTLPAVMGAVLPGTQPGGTPSTMAAATKRPEALTQPVVTPGQDAHALGSAPTGNAVFKGDAKERLAATQKADEDVALAEMLKSPGYTDEEKSSIKLAMATGNKAAVADILKQKLADHTITLFRTDPTRRTVERFDENTGQWTPHVGPIPKNHQFLQEPNQTVMSASMFSPEALAVYQRLVESGAVQPALTRSNAPVMNKVLGAIGREGDQAVSDLTGARSGYAADSDALKQTTKALSAITSFEGTAKKNIAVMQGLIGKVTDTGYPILNAPIRSLEGKLGDPNVAAFHASIKTVVPEIARIITQPNLTGQLTDSAREDIAGILSGDATVGTMMSVLSVLLQDMGNRSSELQKQKDALEAQIKTRGTGHPGHETNANTTHPVDGYVFDPATGKFK